MCRARRRRRAGYRGRRHERSVGVVDRDDQPGRGPCRQSASHPALRPALFRAGLQWVRRARRGSGAVDRGRRFVPSRRPSDGRSARRDGRRGGRRWRRVRRDRRGRSRALERGHASIASRCDADQGQPRPERCPGATGPRCRRVADGDSRQPRSSDRGRRGAPGLRRWWHHRDARRRRIVVRADRDHPDVRILRRPDRPSAAGPRARGDRRRRRPRGHRLGRIADTAAGGMQAGQGGTLRIADGGRPRRTAWTRVDRPRHPGRAWTP